LEKLVFGLSKRERARKQLNVAVEVFLAGQREMQQGIFSTMAPKADALAVDVVGGGNAYQAATDLIQAYLMKTLDALPTGERQRVLRAIADKNYDDQPNVFRLIAHVSYFAAVLEDGEMPLAPEGTATRFINGMSTWFTDNESAQKRIQGYLTESARRYQAAWIAAQKRNPANGAAKAQRDSKHA
tara:strand:- start:195 stop:749 length:555 start_codon:yes stop_codon:yes gene_type:complete